MAEEEQNIEIGKFEDFGIQASGTFLTPGAGAVNAARAHQDLLTSLAFQVDMSADEFLKMTVMFWWENSARGKVCVGPRGETFGKYEPSTK